MGRYYQTTERNYRDDFIYQPPYELIQAVLAKKDADIQDQLNTIEILGQLPVDYWKEADQTNVENVQKKYEEMANSVAKMYQQDPLNPQNKRALNLVKKELSKDYQSGELSKISENLGVYRQHLEDYNKLDDTAKAIYAKMKDNYLEKVKNPDGDGRVGALKEVFKPTQMMATRDFFKEWLQDVFTKMSPNQTAEDKSTWDMMKVLIKKGMDEKSLENNYKAWILQHQAIPEYAKNRQAAGEGIYFDDAGNISFKEGTVFGNQLAAAKAMHYNQQTLDLGNRGRSGGDGSGGSSGFIPPVYKKVENPYKISSFLTDRMYELIYSNLPTKVEKDAGAAPVSITYKAKKKSTDKNGNPVEKTEEVTRNFTKETFAAIVGKNGQSKYSFIHELINGNNKINDTTITNVVNSQKDIDSSLAQASWSYYLENFPKLNQSETQKIVAQLGRNVPIISLEIGGVTVPVNSLSELNGYNFSVKGQKKVREIKDYNIIPETVLPYMVNKDNLNDNLWIADVVIDVEDNATNSAGNIASSNPRDPEDKGLSARQKTGTVVFSMEQVNIGGDGLKRALANVSGQITRKENEISLLEREVNVSPTNENKKKLAAAREELKTFKNTENKLNEKKK